MRSRGARQLALLVRGRLGKRGAHKQVLRASRAVLGASGINGGVAVRKETVMIRAKFKVVETRQVDYGSGKQEVVKLSAASGEGNETWSKWTPSGSIEMSITNPDAVNQLELGKHFFVDFTPADEAR